VSSHKAHWRHLANAIELVHPSAHSSSQPKRQIDRFSRFGRSFVKRVALCYQTVVCPSVLSVRLSCLSVCLSMTLVYCGQTVGWIKMKIGKEVGLGPGHSVKWGLSSTSRKGAQPLIFSHVCCGQTAGWIKMPLGTEVDVGPDNIVLHENPAPPVFGLCLLWPNGWRDHDATW